MQQVFFWSFCSAFRVSCDASFLLIFLFQILIKLGRYTLPSKVVNERRHPSCQKGNLKEVQIQRMCTQKTNTLVVTSIDEGILLSSGTDDQSNPPNIVRRKEKKTQTQASKK